jgi:two-component system CheB/CheR fusion protein
LPDVEWGTSPDGNSRWYSVQFIPLWDAQHTIVGVNLVFSDVTRSKQLQTQLQQSKHELETAYEELQSSNEELETTNEELQSTVEELETTNEELQSTNEELETMNEELQSTNEELETVNVEIRERGSELNRVNGFLETILTSLHVGVVVVGPEMMIKAWNRSAENLWGLRSEEVEGTNFLNLDTGLPVNELRQMIRDCLQGGEDQEQAVVNARDRRGKEIRCRITCMPLVQSTDGSARSGVILLMEELPDDGAA